MRTARFVLVLAALSALALGSVGCEEEMPPPQVPPPTMPPWGTATAPSSPEPPPLGRLPSDVRPLHYAISLSVDPDKERFSGSVDVAIDILEPLDVLWIHGRDLKATRVSVTIEHEVAPIEARWEDADPSGVVALHLPRPIGPGKADLHVEYDAPFNTHPEGLFLSTVAGKRYAFTQLEPSDARRIFPSFDEPAFKTPLDLTLVVPRGEKAIANAHETGRVSEGLTDRVTFATTAPLPTYLFAIAVGPLDVVEGPPVPPNAARKTPLPLRGVATAGRGPDLAYALAHAGAFVSALEGYFGIAYPFDKLDLIAVPNLGGAMENAGAVTFREWLLLVDPKTASIDQMRSFDGVVAHELAHQWFGDLVTMKWWDDVWLNEAFATWMGTRVVASVSPEDHADEGLLDAVYGAMGTDALVSARAIRQPIEGQDDVANAFDDITYRKGGGVLGMFERWLGPEIFRAGIKSYLTAHRSGSGSTEDLLAALSVASQRDVVTPFKSFLDQPGVPFIEASVHCEKGQKDHYVALKQSRYFGLGSSGDPKSVWQVPVCARYAVGKDVKQTCTLLTEAEGKLPLEGEACPSWVMPNADGAGYYRWALPATDLQRLQAEGFAKLTSRERMSVVNSVWASFSRGTLQADVVLKALAPLAKESKPSLASAPMELVKSARDWLFDGTERTAVEAYGAKLYEGAYRDLGWAAPKGAKKAEDPDRALLRQRVLKFLAFTARDPAVRREGAKLGRAYLGLGGDGAIHPDAVDPTLVILALSLAVQEGGAEVFDALDKRLGATEDALLRGRILDALGAAQKPDLAARARALVLDPRLRSPEVTQPLFAQLDMPETRDATWGWLVQNLDAVIAHIPPSRAGGLPWAASRFCDEAHVKAAKQVFGARLDKLEGGPRNLASATEAIGLCVARRGAHTETLRVFFGGKKAPASSADARNITPSKL